MSASSDEQPRRRGLLGTVWSRLTRPREADALAQTWGLDAEGNRVRDYAGPAPRRASGAAPPPAKPVHEAARRVYLSVPFAEKDAGKEAGARWDRDKRQWYAEPGRLSDLARWMPKGQDEQRSAAPAPVVVEVARDARGKPEERQYLEVPFADKDSAKARGAMWDKGTKAWYVPAGKSLGAFEAWLPGNGQAPAAKLDPIEEFGKALRANGLRPDLSRRDHGQIVADGQLHRVPVEGKPAHELKGAYALWLNGGAEGTLPTGWHINFGEGQTQRTPWHLKGAQRDPVDKAKLAEFIKQREGQKMAEEKERERQVARVAAMAADIWSRSEPAALDHPYLDRKAVPGLGSRVAPAGQTITVRDEAAGKDATREMGVDGWLVEPVTGQNGRMVGLQFISPEEDGPKLPLPGTPMKGGYRMVGELGRSLDILVAEGVATAKTLHEITGLPVAAAFSAGNLMEVAAHLQAVYPERAIYLAGDNDHRKERETDPKTGKPKVNVGKVRAEEAAAAIGSVALLPPFQPHERGSDWNDFARMRGPATARSVLLGQVREVELGQGQEARQANVVPFERHRERAATRAAGQDMER